MKKKFSKSDFSSIAKNALATVAGGAGASLIDHYVATSTTNMLIKGLVGVAGPVVVKDPTLNKVFDSMLAITAYQAANTYVIPKLSVAGLLPSQNAVGASTWIAQHAAPSMSNYSQKKPVTTAVTVD